MSVFPALSVMAGLVPAIHVVTSAYAAFNCDETPKPLCGGTTWMPGTIPGMTAAARLDTLFHLIA